MMKYLLIALLGCMVAAGLAIAIPVWFSDTDLIKGVILERLQEAVGAQVRIDHLELDLFPVPQIKVINLAVSEPGWSEPLLQWKQGQCQISFFPLLQGIVILEECVADQPKITLTRQQDGTWSIPAVKKPNQGHDASHRFLLGGFKEISVINGEVTLVNQTKPKQPQIFTISHINLTIQSDSSRTHLIVRLSGKPAGPLESSKIVFAGKIEGKVLLAGKEPSFVFHQITGRTEIIDWDLSPLLEITDSHWLAKEAKLLASLDTDLTLFPDVAGYTLACSDLSIHIGNLNLTGKASVSGLATPQPALFLTGSTTPFPISTIQGLLAIDQFSPDIQTRLARKNLGGQVDIKTITIAGALTEHASLSVIGEAHIDDGWFAFDSRFPPVRQVEGTIILEPTQLTVLNVRAEYEHSKIREGMGQIEFRDPELWFSASAMAELTAQDVMTTLARNRQVRKTIQPVLDMEHVQGTGILNLTVEGPLHHPDQLRIQQGDLIVQNLELASPVIPLPLREITGQLMLSKKQLIIQDLEGKFGASSAAIQGQIEFRDPEPWLTLSAMAELTAQDVMMVLTQETQLWEKVQPWIQREPVDGSGNLVLKVEGPLHHPDQLRIQQGDLIVQNLELASQTLLGPLKVASGRMRLSQERLVIKNLEGQIGSSKAVVEGTMTMGKKYEFQNVAVHGLLDPTDLKTFLPGLYEKTQMTGGPISISGILLGAIQKPVIRGKIEFDSVDIGFPQVFHKPSGIPLWMEFESQVAAAQGLKINWATIKMPPFRLGLKGNIALKGQPSFDVIFRNEPETASLIPRNVTLGINQFQIQDLNLSLDMKGTEEDWTAWTVHGLINLNGLINLKGKEEAEQKDSSQVVRIWWDQVDHTAKAQIRMTGFPVEGFATLTGSPTSRLTGTLSGQAELQTVLRDSQLVKRSLTSQGEFQIANGRFIYGPVLSQIFSVMNLPSLLMGKVDLLKDGLPFYLISGNISVKDGILTTSNLRLDSPVMKMTAAGNYDWNGDQLDVMIAVSPFGAYSDLMKNIPLFGQLLRGERKGLTTALFEVRGTRDDPKVTYRPLESFTGGLKGFAQFAVDVLDNVITMSKDVLPASQKSSPQR